MQSKPLFLEPQALQKITPETHFSVQTTRKGKVGTFAPFLFWCLSLQATSILEKSHRNLRKVPKTSCTWRFSCAFLSSPPLSPKSTGGMLDIYIYIYIYGDNPFKSPSPMLRVLSFVCCCVLPWCQATDDMFICMLMCLALVSSRCSSAASSWLSRPKHCFHGCNGSNHLGLQVFKEF